MKKILYLLTFAFAVVACADFTDLEPKGKSLLDKAEDLDLLLNSDYQSFSSPGTVTLTNAMLPSLTNIPGLLVEKVKTTKYALTFWDEDVDRIKLADTDSKYEGFYSVIGKICNPVIERADAAVGSRVIADRAKAEAYVLRAWFHYLAVNLYARAYDPATAETTPGVPYSLETDVMADQNVKYTVREVYDYILADLDAALALEAFPDEGVNKQRVGRSFAYGVQAKALMSMHRFDDALVAARNSMAINNHVDNHNDMIEILPSLMAGVLPDIKAFQRPFLVNKEDLFSVFTGLIIEAVSPEMIALFDPSSVLLRYLPTFGRMGYDLLGIDLGSMYYGMTGLHVIGSNYDVFTFSGAGLTSVDMRLIEAECLMRQGQLAQAMEKLEYIRERRLIADEYEPLPVPSTKAGVFAVLKQLSRCENFFTFKDFIDLKRWNGEPEYAAALHKELLGVEYALAPDSPLWIFPFPQTATNFNTNLTQNY